MLGVLGRFWEDRFFAHHYRAQPTFVRIQNFNPTFAFPQQLAPERWLNKLDTTVLGIVEGREVGDPFPYPRGGGGSRGIGSGGGGGGDPDMEGLVQGETGDVVLVPSDRRRAGGLANRSVGGTGCWAEVKLIFLILFFLLFCLPFFYNNERV